MPASVPRRGEVGPLRAIDLRQWAVGRIVEIERWLIG